MSESFGLRSLAILLIAFGAFSIVVVLRSHRNRKKTPTGESDTFGVFWMTSEAAGFFGGLILIVGGIALLLWFV